MSEPTPEDQAAAIQAALFAGSKIEAIKLYRDQTKVGLAEAKAAVEKLEAELRQTTPGSFTAAPAKGCGAVILVAATLAPGVWRAFA
jgi:hypothetical protein